MTCHSTWQPEDGRRALLGELNRLALLPPRREANPLAEQVVVSPAATPSDDEAAALLVLDYGRVYEFGLLGTISTYFTQALAGFIIRKACTHSKNSVPKLRGAPNG